MSTIITKNSSTPGVVPAAIDLVLGELAVNTADGKLFMKLTNDSVIDIVNNTTQITLDDVLSSGNTSSLALTCGTFTSTGIDDNATSERLQVQDGSLNLGTASSNYIVDHIASNRALQFLGGTAGSPGGELTIFGGTHATQANDLELRSSSNTFLKWDESVGDLELLTGTGVKTPALTLTETGYTRAESRLGVNRTPTYRLDVEEDTGDAIARIYASEDISTADTIFRLSTKNINANNWIEFGDGLDVNVGYIKYAHASDTMSFGTGAALALTLDSSQNATLTNRLFLAGGANVAYTSLNQLIVGSTSNDNGIVIESSPSGTTSALTFGDGALAGRVKYNHATDAMSLATNNNTTALTIDSSQNTTLAQQLRIGATDSASTFRINGAANHILFAGVTGSASYITADSNTATGSNLILRTADAAGLPKTAITIDSNQKATFGGDITVANTTPVVLVKDTNATLNDNLYTASMQFTDSANVIAGTVGYLSNANSDFDINNATATGGLHLKTNGLPALLIDSSQNSVFSGTLQAADSLTLNGGTVIVKNAASTARTIITGGTDSSAGGIIQLYGQSHATQANEIELKTGVTTALTIDASQNSTFSGDVTVSGDLTVNGTTTTLNSTTLQIDDKNIELGTVASPSDATADGGGITLKGATDKTIIWADATNTWDFNQGVKVAGDLTVDKLIIKSNDQNTTTDIQLTDNANIAATENLRFYTDSDNGSTGTKFEWLTNSGSITGATSLMTLTDSGNLTVDGNLTVNGVGNGLFVGKPADFWSGSDHIFTEYGYTGSSGSFATSLYSNGYRNTSSGFTYMGVNGINTTASGLDLLPTGDINLRAGVATGTALPLVQLWDESLGEHKFYTGTGATKTEVLKLASNQIATFGSHIISGGQVITGDASGGSVALTQNDGYGNANVSFNHTNGAPDVTGSSARISCSVDSATSSMSFQVKDSTISGVAVAATQILKLTSGNITTYKTMLPDTNNTLDIGAPSFRYNTMYATVFDGTSTTAQYADLAEMYTADAVIEEGTVVCFGGTHEVTTCLLDATTSIAGVVSTDPAYLMNSTLEGVAVALRGRVPCKVSGDIKKGDVLVSDGNGGARAEANPQSSTRIGRALENSTGNAVIEIVVG